MTPAPGGPPPRLRLSADGVELTPPRGDPVTLTGPRALLLCSLALFGPTARGRLAAWLWPDADGPLARGNLRQLVRRVRAAGIAVQGDPLGLPEGTEIWFPWSDPPAAAPDSSADPFELPDAGERTELAERLVAEAARRRAATATRHAHAVAAAMREGRPEDALAAARTWLAADPRSLEAHLARMRAHRAVNDAHGVLDAHAAVQAMLRRGLDMDPPEEARQLARWAADATREPLVRGRYWSDTAWLDHQRGRHEDAERAARTALSLLGRRPPASEAWFVLGSIARHRGLREEAARHWRQALATLGPQQSPSAERTLRLDLAMVEDGLGRPEAARTHYLAALELAERDGDAADRATILNNLAHLHLSGGRAGDARALATAAASLARGVQDRRLEAHVLDTLARATLEDGDAAQARAFAAQAFAAGREVGDAVLQVEALTTVAEAQREVAGDVSARPLAREALRLARIRGTLPGTFRAALAFARVAGPKRPMVARLLAAIGGDGRAEPSVRRAARRLQRGTEGRDRHAYGGDPGDVELQVDAVLAAENDP